MAHVEPRQAPLWQMCPHRDCGERSLWKTVELIWSGCVRRATGTFRKVIANAFTIGSTASPIVPALLGRVRDLVVSSQRSGEVALPPALVATVRWRTASCLAATGIDHQKRDLAPCVLHDDDEHRLAVHVSTGTCHRRKPLRRQSVHGPTAEPLNSG